MNAWQTNFLIAFAITSLLISAKGFYESYKKKNAFGATHILALLGIFVWGDAVVFGLFWALSSGLSLMANDWILFCLIVSIFWLVRSIGETIYWFLQQFSTVMREEPKNQRLHQYFHNESIWFVNQIFQQCITVFSLLATIHFAYLWLVS